MTDQTLLMAEIVGVHGIKGLVKLKVFGEDAEGLARRASLTDDKGRAVAIAHMIPHGNIWLAELKGVPDRTAAEKLRGTKIYMPRAELPKIKKKNTYYHADLIGLKAVHADGSDMGKVLAVANFGAGDLLEIKPLKGPSYYIPFNDACVPDVDIGAKTVTLDPPEGLLD